MRRALLGTLLACASACSDGQGGGFATEAAADIPELPWAVQPFPALPAETEPAAVLQARSELGLLLFYDPVLSVDGETACASCHSEIWGMGDGLARSIGHGSGLLTGPGRKGGPVVRRNSPQLWNLAFRETLFWDGRVATLEEQALEPLRAEDEMNLPPEDAVAALQAIEEYRERFAAAFPDQPRVTQDNLARALAHFQRGLVSSRSLYDGYLAGDQYALTDGMVDGMFRFAEFGCPQCHAPPLFESEGFHDRGVGPDPGVEDDGRFEVTGEQRDRGAFRVPSLRNVAFSEPYFHNGSVMQLEDAVRHELQRGPLSFDDEDVKAISTFLKDALKDESREPDRPDSLPSGLPVPIDGTFIQR